MNKRSGAVWPLIALLSLWSVALAGPLQDADEAAQRGDNAISMQIWLRLANKGDVAAQLALARAYDCGGCAMYDPTEAKRWYAAAAGKGNGQAQISLAMIYCSLSWLSYPPGPPTAEDLTESVRWLHKAAEQGLPLAEDMLGDDFAQGRGTPRNYSEAARWYKKAAAHGGRSMEIGKAEHSLGELYHLGYGVPQDDSQAEMWTQKAITDGYVPPPSPPPLL